MSVEQKLNEEDLDYIVDELEKRISPTSTRRKLITAGGAGIAALLAASTPASGAPGTIGDGDETFDGDLYTGNTSQIGVFDQIRVPGYGNLTTIQDAVDDIQNDDGMVHIPSQTWNETVVLDENVRFEGQGIATKIEGSGGHTLEVTRQDAEIAHLWLDQVDTGNPYDALHVSAREVRTNNIDVDVADRYACYVDARDCFFDGWRVMGGDEAAFVFTTNANWCQVSDLMVRNRLGNMNDKGVLIETGAAFLKMETSIHNVPGNGLEDNGGDWNRIVATIKNVGDRGAVLTGSKQNFYVLIIDGSTNEDLDCQGDNKVIRGKLGGTLSISGNDNFFVGSFSTLNDTGSRNVVNYTGRNSGNPNTTGAWNGNAGVAYRLGVTVYDTSVTPSVPYEATEDGDWVPKTATGSYLYPSTSQSVDEGSWIPVEFDSTKFDDRGEADLANNQFVAANAGKYNVSFSVSVDDISAGDRLLVRVFKNSTEEARDMQQAGGSNFFAVAGKTLPMELSEGDTLSVEMFHEGGNGQSLSSGGTQTYLAATQI